MEIIEETQDGIKIFRLVGRLDFSTSQGLEDEIHRAISDGSSNKIIIDFENLDYISSAGLHTIFEAHRTILKNDGQLILCSMLKYIKEIFKTTRIDDYVLILDNLDQALAAF